MKFSVLFLVFFSLIFYQPVLGANRLAVSGNKFTLNCKVVFLAGVNFAWFAYGYDFGNGQYAANSQTTFNNWLNEVASNGGNTVRKFFFCLVVLKNVSNSLFDIRIAM